MKPIPMEERCVEDVYESGRMGINFHRCRRRGTTEHEGKKYCKGHNPLLRVAKYAARQVQRQQEYYEKERQLKAVQIKRQAERAVIEAAVAWRMAFPDFSPTGAYLDYATIVRAIDRLMALG